MEVIIVNSTSNNQDKTPGKILFKQMLSGLEQQYVIQWYDVFVKWIYLVVCFYKLLDFVVYKHKQ